MLRDTLARTLAADPRVLAVWEGGSASFGRLDEGSDLDLQAIVEDDAAEDTWAAIEAALRSLGTIEVCYRVPSGGLHDHSQRFYRLAEAGPLLLLDICLMRRSDPERFLEPERHGRPVVLLDREGLLADPPAARPPGEDVLDRLAARIEMFHPFCLKELARGRGIDALAFFQSLMRDVVQLLRLRYDPLRWDFGLRYLHHDLPAEVASEVQALLYVARPEDLPEHHARALALARATVAALRPAPRGGSPGS